MAIPNTRGRVRAREELERRENKAGLLVTILSSDGWFMTGAAERITPVPLVRA